MTTASHERPGHRMLMWLGHYHPRVSPLFYLWILFPPRPGQHK